MSKPRHGFEDAAGPFHRIDFVVSYDRDTGESFMTTMTGAFCRMAKGKRTEKGFMRRAAREGWVVLFESKDDAYARAVAWNAEWYANGCVNFRVCDALAAALLSDTAVAASILGLEASVSVDTIKKAVRALIHPNRGDEATEKIRKILQAGAHLLEMAR